MASSIIYCLAITLVVVLVVGAFCLYYRGGDGDEYLDFCPECAAALESSDQEAKP